MTTILALRNKLTLVVLICLGSLSVINAQNKITAFGSYGISDIQVSGLGILDLLDPYIKPIAQYTAGLQFEKEIGNHISFLTGAQYTSRGFTAKEDFNVNVFGLDLPIGARIDTRLQYIEVPLMLKYSIGEKGIIPYVKAGASTAYAVSGKFQPKIDAIISWNLPAININLQNDMYNRLDVSAVVGAGVNIPTNETGSIQFDINYRHSLNDMFLDKITDIRIKSHGLSVGVGYTVRF
ncbi:MAG: PorT family protein [Saprospiraceae bacterium]|uniref:PorT family protein n=1 Tax=Candidatus Opimibacter skivensis TaxID=2982028 RepID=A0A9D7SR53_9BACT|nr:PorT family protein [Candidatus Opimibacter skivensis]